MEEKLSKILRMGLLDALERNEEQRRFLGIIQRLAELLPPKSEEPAFDRHVCEGLVRLIIEETDFEDCSIVLWDPDSKHLSLKASYSVDELLGGDSVKSHKPDLSLDSDEGIAGRVFRTQSPLFLEDGMSDALSPKTCSMASAASMVCLPLIDSGVLIISSTHPRRFSSQDRRNWELISRIIGLLLRGTVTSKEGFISVTPFSPNTRYGKPHSHPDTPVTSRDLPLPQQAMKNTPQGICLLDACGNIIEVNQSIEHRHEINSSMLKGRSPAILFTNPSEFDQLFEHEKASQTRELINVSMVGCKGESYPADVNLVELSDATGKTSGYLLIIQDMTKWNVLTEKLIQGEKLAAMGIMASGVAHDFNNLLMAILGNVQLMLPTITDEDIQKRLHSIEKAVQGGAATIRRLQKFTERTWDSRQVSSVADVSEAISDVIELTRPRWKDAMERSGRSIRFQLDTSSRCFASISDSDLREVLTNLVFNAVEAMPEGGVIAVSCKPVDGEILLEFSDTGVGMDSEVMARVFDPFYTTKGVGSSGLGLSISWSLITRCGGEIRVRSTPGKGTVLEISLPKTGPSLTVERACKPEPSPESSKLLIIDDDPEILEVLRDMLRLKGHRVTATNSGPEALHLIESQDFDLVLTDLGMPAVSGWDIAKSVKAKDPHVPVILATGSSDQYDEDDLTASGVDRILSKPFNWDRLIETVADLLNSVSKEALEPTLPSHDQAIN
jgi:PAS domain S-box-containing protein